MDVSAVWKKGMSFTGTAFTSNFSLAMGASPKVGGANDGFRPLELVLVGLAGCTAMDVISILEKKRQQITAFEVKAHGDQADEHPRSLVRFELEYIVTGKGIDREAVERAVELSQTKYCSVAATLRSAGPIETKITLLDG
jgi:putative redox protein